MSLRQGRNNTPATPGSHGHTGIPRRLGIGPAVACVVAAVVVTLTVTFAELMPVISPSWVAQCTLLYCYSTMSVTVVECDSEPEVAVMVKV